jgi:hypothetical protein
MTAGDSANAPAPDNVRSRIGGTFLVICLLDPLPRRDTGNVPIVTQRVAKRDPIRSDSAKSRYRNLTLRIISLRAQPKSLAVSPLAEVKSSASKVRGRR